MVNNREQNPIPPESQGFILGNLSNSVARIFNKISLNTKYKQLTQYATKHYCCRRNQQNPF